MMPLGMVPKKRSVLSAYMERLGLEDSVLREDGRLRLQVDARYRVDLLALPGGRLAILSDLADLGSWPAAQVDNLLLHLLELAAGLLRDHACGLVIDARRQRLQLQQVLPSEASVDDLEQAMAGFLNVLPFWSQTCRQEVEALYGPSWPNR